MKARSLNLAERLSKAHQARLPSSCPRHRWLDRPHRRGFRHDSTQSVPDFAFAFDIDGVLVRSANAIPHASATLQFLQRNSIPFILLTNGGGKHESERVKDLSSKLAVRLDTSMFVQSHTPFAELIHGEQNLRDKCVMVVGGEGARCREVAEMYGFTDVVTPGDIYAAHPEIWPFSKPFLHDYYGRFARPLSRGISSVTPGKEDDDGLKIDAVFVYNDPRDWGLDLQVILDVMLSRGGIVGTYSAKNGDRTLPNAGYLQDGQPPLYFSNPDLLWAAHYHLSRLGQGGFREALEGLWRAVTAQHSAPGPHGQGPAPELYKTVIGKPYRETYAFAERLLLRHRDELFGNGRPSTPALRKVYMVGDNPESDIRGANTYESPHGVEWVSLLTRTGVYRDRDGHRPTWEPRAIVDDVRAAVQYALKDSAWAQKLEQLE